MNSRLTGPASDILVLRVVGEIYLATLPLVENALTTVLYEQPADVVVDLAGVGFCSVRGFALLATAAHTMQASGAGFAVSGMLPHLDRIATLLWPQQRCVRYRSVAAAVTAIRLIRPTAGLTPRAT